MVKKNQSYHLGLDIGTGSIGFVALNDDGSLVKARSKSVIGVRLFENGKTAEERRLSRSVRRNNKRKKSKIRLLNNIFDEHLNKVDPNFLIRLKDSNLLPKDKDIKLRGPLLFTEGDDGDFKRKYPTLYHLRYALINSDEKFDLRMIYLAMHHIIKYRGHFLNPTPVGNFISNDKSISDYLLELNDQYNELIKANVINTANLNEIDEILKNTDISNNDKQKSISKLLNTDNDDKKIKKQISKINAELAKAIIGNQAKLNVLLDPNNDSDFGELKVYLSAESIDEEVEEILPKLDSIQTDILTLVRQLYAKVSLSQIATSNEGISKSMIDKYNQHKEHLKMYKEMIAGMSDTDKKQNLRDAYSSYVHNNNQDKISLDEFYKRVNNNIDPDYKNVDTIKNLIATDNFMPKQKTFNNAIIPHQLHQIEMQKIIDKQKKYYPWLGEINPNKSRLNQAKYMLEELVAFKIPYFVGPLITKDTQMATSGKNFAWMVRKESGEITPWNFEEKVDLVASANNFIKRMTKKDTYLLDEDVLPDASLLYEKYKVLSELNMIRVNGQHLNSEIKQDIFNNLFKDKKTVSAKRLKEYLVDKNIIATANPKIEGLANPKKFNNSLCTFYDMKRVFGEDINDSRLQDKLEDIIEWSTIFEDRKVFKTKLLADASWLTENQINDLSKKHYSGWGRLSKKLLTGLKNSDDESIIDLLWKNNINLMQVVTNPEFKKLIDESNHKYLSSRIGKEDNEWIEELLQNSYTSPQNRKAIRQVIKVVDDIKKAMHGVYPKTISIEFAREPGDSHNRTIDRTQQIKSLYKQLPKKLVDNELNNELKNISGGNKGMTDKEYLYFKQLGRDMYVNDGYGKGKKINFNELANYHIDHILPQAFIKDDSLNNRVLTNSSSNMRKSNSVPNEIFGKQMGNFWRLLNSNGLMSNRKLKNLTLNPNKIDKYTSKGFINRQLVETRQIVKLIANILCEKYPAIKIIEVPARVNTQIRRDFQFIKNRNVNDYHHAFDAYLTAFTGTYFYSRYPKLRSYFVYGENAYVNENDVKLKSFNFLHDLYVDDLSTMSDKPYFDTVSKYKLLLTHQARKIYEFKFMLVSHEIGTNNSEMFKQTIYSPKSNKSKIPIKNNLPTKDYGGYTNNKDSYMAIIKIKGAKKNTYKVMGVSRRWSDSLSSARKKSNSEYIKLLRSYLKETKIIRSEKKDKKTGEITITYKPFEILCPKVYYYQLVEEGNNKFLMTSSKYLRNGKQLVLDNETIETLDLKTMKDMYSDIDTNDELSKRYNYAYKEIIDKSIKYFPVFNIGKYNEKLSNAYEKFEKLNNLDKLETLNAILQGIHYCEQRKSISKINISDLGKIQVPSGINLSKGAKICFMSPTGLFTKKIELD